MKYNDFNNRVNLQFFCEANGVTGYNFIRIPRFGWFAIHKTTGAALTLMDFLPVDKMVEFCTDIIVEKQHYHEGRIKYNEFSVTRLCNDIRILMAIRNMHRDAVEAYKDGVVWTDGSQLVPHEQFKKVGMEAFQQTGVGYLSDAVYNSYRVQLGLAKNLLHKLIIPTWCSPTHVCTLEWATIDAPTKRTTFWKNDEKGWYGKPAGTVYGSFNNLLTHPGCTWDRKLNYWVSHPLQIHSEMDVSQCLQIWKEAASDLRFKQSPLDIIEGNKGQGKLKFNLDGLTGSQITQLEKRFDVKLASYWQSQKQEQVTLRGQTYVYKDMRYFAENKWTGELEEFTNFAVEVKRIFRCRKTNKLLREGIIYYEGKEEPFALDNSCFVSNSKFCKELNRFFVESALGIPIIANVFGRDLLELVNRLNMHAIIDVHG